MTSTATAPNVSEATSRNAPRAFRLSAWARRSRISDTPLPASAMQPNTAISPVFTGGGEASRRAASTTMNVAMISSSRALAVAARISARA